MAGTPAAERAVIGVIPVNQDLGTALVKLPEVIRAGGTTTITVPQFSGAPREIVVPRLAVARAHRSACWTFGVDNETTSTSIPTRSMSSRRLATSVIAGVTPKKRAPR